MYFASKASLPRFFSISHEIQIELYMRSVWKPTSQEAIERMKNATIKYLALRCFQGQWKMFNHFYERLFVTSGSPESVPWSGKDNERILYNNEQMKIIQFSLKLNAHQLKKRWLVEGTKEELLSIITNPRHNHKNKQVRLWRVFAEWWWKNRTSGHCFTQFLSEWIFGLLFFQSKLNQIPLTQMWLGPVKVGGFTCLLCG